MELGGRGKGEEKRETGGWKEGVMKLKLLSCKSLKYYVIKVECGFNATWG